MNFDLLDYQRQAVAEILNRLGRARSDQQAHNVKSAFALSATTGAGKTVIATAVIEAMLFGSAEFGVEADPRATFLWVTDDPALNRQTRNKMQVASDLISLNHLEVLNESYFEPTLEAGHVYFLNIQQLSKNAQFSNVAGDSMRTKSGWQIIGDTITSDNVDLYVIVDEAHRGMKVQQDRSSIVRQIIDGRPESNPAAPSVWGISATIERFDEAMAGISARTKYEPVEVALSDVQASGLIKDRIELFEPDESGTFTMTLLRTATRRLIETSKRWSDYKADQPNEPLVEPILVVQVADNSSDADLAELVAAIEDEWPTVGPHAIVNVFGEHVDRNVPGRTVRYLAPEKVEDDPQCRVVFAKTAISTGWDCPRAEVLYSQRAAEDATHIAQIIGRMVRQPLARRVPTDDVLNSVWCFLPEFKLSAVEPIVDALNDPSNGSPGPEVITHGSDFARNAALDAEVFELLEQIPCLPKPDPLANPLRRGKALAKLLTDTSTGAALVPDANADLTTRMNQRIKGLLVEHETEVDTVVADLKKMTGRHTSIGLDQAEAATSATTSIDTAASDLINDTRRIVASVREGIAKDFLRHSVEIDVHLDIDEFRTRVAGLIRVTGTIPALEDTANSWVTTQLDTHRVAIKHTTGALKAGFLRVQGQAASPEPSTMELPTVIRSRTRIGNDEDAPQMPTLNGHLYSDENGGFPVSLNTWEAAVMDAEFARQNFVAWYRNPSRPNIASHRIAYQTDAGDWASVQPDFIVVSQNNDGRLAASIIDPHGDHLADARAKLNGLADFAEQYGDHFLRVESIAETDAGLRVLDLQQSVVRDAVRNYAEAQVTALYESSVASNFV